MRPLTACCGRYHEESVRSKKGIGGTSEPGSPGRRPAPISARPSRQRITRRPEEDYRTALLSDSPDAGCSLCGWSGEWGSEPDAKPVRGTPRAGRRAAVVAPSFGALWSAGWSGTDDKRGHGGLQAAGPRHQLQPSDRIGASAQANNKTNQRSNQSRAVARKPAALSL